MYVTISTAFNGSERHDAIMIIFIHHIW